MTFLNSCLEFQPEAGFVRKLSTVEMISVQQLMLDSRYERRYEPGSRECVRRTNLLQISRPFVEARARAAR